MFFYGDQTSSEGFGRITEMVEAVILFLTILFSLFHLFLFSIKFLLVVQKKRGAEAGAPPVLLRAAVPTFCPNLLPRASA